MSNKKKFLIVLISFGLILFSGCYKRAEQATAYLVDVNFTITVKNNDNQPVMGEFIYYRMLKYTGYSNTIANLEEGKNLSNNEGKISVTFNCMITPAEVIRLYGMLNGFSDPNLKLKSIFYDEVEAASFDGEYALLEREITLYMD